MVRPRVVTVSVFTPVGGHGRGWLPYRYACNKGTRLLLHRFYTCILYPFLDSLHIHPFETSFCDLFFISPRYQPFYILDTVCTAKYIPDRPR